MAFPPPGGTPGPFGPGGTGVPPPGGFPPPGVGFPPPGFGPRGGVVVHSAGVLPRLLVVGVVLLLSFGVTGAIVWFSFLGADGIGRHDGPTRVIERGPDAQVAGSPGGTATGPTLPAGWPEALTPPPDATILSSVSSSAGTPDAHLVMVLEVDGEPAAVVGALREQLFTAGIAISTDAVNVEGFGSISAEGAGWDVTIATGPKPDHPGTTTVNWVLSAS